MKQFLKNFFIIFLGIAISAGNIVPAIAVAEPKLEPNYAVVDAILTPDSFSYTLKNTETVSKTQTEPLVIWYTWQDQNGTLIGLLQKEVTPPGPGTVSFLLISSTPGTGDDLSDFLFSSDHTNHVLQVWMNPKTSIQEKNANYKDNKVFLNWPSADAEPEASEVSSEASSDIAPEDSASVDAFAFPADEVAAPAELPDMLIIGLVMEEDGLTVVVKNDGTVSTGDSVSAVIQWVTDGTPVGTNAIKINFGPIGPGEEATKKLAAGGITQVGQFLGSSPIPGAMIQVIVDPEDVIKESDDTGNNIKMVAPISEETDGAELVKINSDAQEVLPGYDPVVLPGNPLYFFKQFIQKVQELLTFSDEAKAELAVHTAAKKAKELEALIVKGDEASLSTALELYTEEIAEAAEQIEALDPENPETQEIATTAFEQGLRTQILFGEVMAELSGEDLAAAAEAKEVGMGATADALEIMSDPEEQKASIEEVFTDSGDPLDALGNAAILEDLADHIGDEDEAEEVGVEETGEEAGEFEIVEEDAFGEEMPEEEAAEDGSFDNEFGFEESEEQGLESEEDLFLFEEVEVTEGEEFVEQSVEDVESEFEFEEEDLGATDEEEPSPLEFLLAQITEDFVEEAATQIEILAEDNPELVSDYVENMTDGSATDIISVLDEVAQEASTPAVQDIVEQSMTKVVNAVSEQIANSETPEETAAILLPVPKKDPLKSMRILQKVSEQTFIPAAVATHVEKSFTQAVTDFANTLEKQTPEARTVTIEKIARTAPDLTQVIILNKVNERLAAIPTEQPALLRTAVATLQEKVTEQIQETIAAAPTPEARQKALLSVIGSRPINSAAAEQLQTRLGIQPEEIAAVKEEVAVVQERRAAIEQGIIPKERPASKTEKTEVEIEPEETLSAEAGIEVVESKPVDTAGDEKKQRDEALRRKEAADKKKEDERAEAARRSELLKQQEELKRAEAARRQDAADKKEADDRNEAARRAELLKQQEDAKRKETPATVTPQRRTATTTVTTSTRRTTTKTPAAETAPTREQTTVTPQPAPTRQETTTSEPSRTTETTPAPTRTSEPAPTPTPAPTRTVEPPPEPTPTRTITPAPTPTPAPTTETRTRTQSVSLDSLFNNFISEVGNSVTVVKNLLTFSVFAATGFFLR